MARKVIVTIRLPAFKEAVEIPDRITTDTEAYAYAKNVTEERFADKLRDDDAFRMIYPGTVFTVMGNVDQG